MKRQKYSPEEIKYILDNGHMLSCETIAKHLDRSESNIRKILHKNGISLLPEYKRNAGTQFKKGQISWNNGLKLGNRPNSGQFKKGTIPPNQKSNGTISIRYNNKRNSKYTYLKVNNKWVLYHRYIWEKAYGKIPKGACIIFVDGNSLNVILDNLKLVTRKEHLSRNHVKYWNKSKLSDKHIAGLIARNNPELRKELIRYPKILEAKRLQLELSKVINEVEK